MIVPMKKYSFLVYHAVYLDFLENLREIGVVDVVEKQAGQMEENTLLFEQLEQRKRLNSLIKIFKAKLPAEAQVLAADSSMEAAPLIERLQALLNKQAETEAGIQLLNKEIKELSIWGDFDPARLAQLDQAGCRLDFYYCQRSAFKPEWQEEQAVLKIAEIGNMVYFISIRFDGQAAAIEAEHLNRPKKSLSELQMDLNTVQRENQQVQEELQKAALEHYNSLLYLDQVLSDEFNFSKVLLGTEKAAGEKIRILEGFVSKDKEDQLRTLLSNEGIYYRAEQATPEDKIPILLKNNAYARLFEPITRMYSLPNYGELDLTNLIAPFFMLFFGLCLGDGGYGILIFLAATIIKPKLKPSFKSIASLAQILGSFTVLIGILTGSFFGIALESLEWTWLKGVKQYFLTEDNYAAMFGGYHPLMILSLVIGLVQILFGMVVNVIKIHIQLGFKYAVSKLAWVVLLLSLMAGFGLPALGVLIPLPLMYVFYALLGLAVLVILFYNSPDKNIFTNMGLALWETYGMASGLLGDTLSYVRLFALGLTGSILGSVFNSLAFGMTEAMPPWIRWVVVLLILLFGHSLNIALNTISAIVHPLRLTFVEFYKNAGFEGGGKAYKPFKKTVQTN